MLERSNYFDGPTKLFSDLYLAKFLDTNKTVVFRERMMYFI